jgi:phosphate:Na+ symporter
MAKRAAMLHFLFNILGTVAFGTIMFFVFFFNRTLAQANISSVEISIFHTIFNVTSTVLLFPFANVLVRLSGTLVRGEEKEEEENPLEDLRGRLDKRILENPGFAIEAAQKEIGAMGRIALENIKRAKQAMMENDKKAVEKIVKWEEIVNGYEEQLTKYLVLISGLSLNENQHLKVKNMLYTISDMERVSDHCENLSELAAAKIEKNLTFSEAAKEGLNKMMDKVLASYEAALQARITGETHFVEEEAAFENTVDDMERKLRKQHFERLAEGRCNPAAGVYYMDAISNLERISDHAENIAGYVLEEL